MTNETRTPSPADGRRIIGYRNPAPNAAAPMVTGATDFSKWTPVYEGEQMFTYAPGSVAGAVPSPADGQRLWRDIKTAPDNELIFVWDYGTIRQSIRKDGAWISEWEGIPPPGFPTLWLPIFPYPDGADV